MRSFLSLAPLFVVPMSAQNDVLTAVGTAVGTAAVHKPLGCKDNLSVERTCSGWYVKNCDTNTYHFVQKAHVDKQLRNVSPEQFVRMMKSGKGYVALNQCDDGSYTIIHKGRLNGGGPYTAYILYGTTKGLAYGTMATAAGATVASAAGPAVGAYVTGMTVSSAGSVVASSGTAAATAAGAASSGAAGATGAALGGAGAVESAAWGAFAVGLWLPAP